LTADSFSLVNTSCRAAANSTHYVLTADTADCESSRVVSSDSVIHQNSVSSLCTFSQFRTLLVSIVGPPLPFMKCYSSWRPRCIGGELGGFAPPLPIKVFGSHLLGSY